MSKHIQSISKARMARAAAHAREVLALVPRGSDFLESRRIDLAEAVQGLETCCGEAAQRRAENTFRPGMWLHIVPTKRDGRGFQRTGQRVLAQVVAGDDASPTVALNGKRVTLTRQPNGNYSSPVPFKVLDAEGDPATDTVFLAEHVDPFAAVWRQLSEAATDDVATSMRNRFGATNVEADDAGDLTIFGTGAGAVVAAMQSRGWQQVGTGSRTGFGPAEKWKLARGGASVWVYKGPPVLVAFEGLSEAAVPDTYAELSSLEQSYRRSRVADNPEPGLAWLEASMGAGRRVPAEDVGAILAAAYRLQGASGNRRLNGLTSKFETVMAAAFRAAFRAGSVHDDAYLHQFRFTFDSTRSPLPVSARPVIDPTKVQALQKQMASEASQWVQLATFKARDPHYDTNVDEWTLYRTNQGYALRHVAWVAADENDDSPHVIQKAHVFTRDFRF